MKKSWTARYLGTFILVLCGSLFLFALLAGRKMNETLTTMYKSHLQWTADLMETVLITSTDDGALEDFIHPGSLNETATRLTIITPDGTVVGDSHYDARLLDNHGDRPEVRRALAGKADYSLRWSDTLKTDMMYYAKPVTLSNGKMYVLRTSVPMADVAAFRKTLMSSVVITALVILLCASLLTFLIHRKTSRPLEEIRVAAYHYAAGTLDYPLHVDAPPGIRNLALDIRAMAEELDKRINLITRQRNELKAIFTSMVEAVIVLDENLVIKALNPAACHLAGCSEDEALKRRLIQVFRSSELDRWVGNLVSRGESWEKELHYAIPPKEDLKDTVTPRERFLQVHGSVFRAGMKDAAEEKSDGRVLLVLHDITELKRLEQIRKDFVANVSHELKTPITSLKGYVETLLDGALDDRPKAEEFLRIVASQTERINAIVTDLLSLSRLEQAGSTLEKEPLPGRSLLESALGVCRRKAEEKRITFDLVCPEELFVPANTLLIEQALVNLIDNAVKYSNAGSVVRLTAKNEGKTVTFQVEDSGCGIPEKDLPRLFERFFRVDRARSRELGGTGLGLAIVKHIALAHGGSVGVSSVEGKGAVFTLRIPSAGLSGSSPAGGSVPSEL